MFERCLAMEMKALKRFTPETENLRRTSVSPGSVVRYSTEVSEVPYQSVRKARSDIL